MTLRADIPRRFLLAAIVAVTAFAAASPAQVGARPSWDGCTSSSGDVTFRAADGTRLVGHRFGGGRAAVVLAHQSDGILCQWVPYAKRLAAKRYLALAFDFRNAGQSQERHYPANLRYGGDVAAAVKEVRRLGATRVFLIGASLGGSAVLQAAANVRPPVDGVISVSGAADLSNAIVSVKRLRVPVIYLAGKDDIDFATDAHRLYEATPSSNRSISILARPEHGVQLVAASSRARTLIESFLRAH